MSTSYNVSAFGKYWSTSCFVFANGKHRSALAASYIVTGSGKYRSTFSLVTASGKYRSASCFVCASVLD